MKSVDELLKEIASRCSAATEGPWTLAEYYPGDTPHILQLLVDIDGCVGPAKIIRDRDAVFVVNARTDIPRLIAALRLAIEQRNFETMNALVANNADERVGILELKADLQALVDDHDAELARLLAGEGGGEK